jgi:putative SOS response-associated peptidase YedK
MCGRYKLTSSAEEFAELFELPEIHPIAPRYNIAPTQPVEIVRMRPESSCREMKPVIWGLIPPWCTDVSMAAKFINARSETLHEKPTYRNPLKRRRCLVPANGFYEWASAGKGKQPYLIQMKNGRLFAFAGLWEVWHGPNGEEIESCTIITGPANELVKQLHNRMPVIIESKHYDEWLNCSDEDMEKARKLLVPPPSSGMILFAVSRAVNDVRNEKPECSEALEPLAPGDASDQLELF